MPTCRIVKNLFLTISLLLAIGCASMEQHYSSYSTSQLKLRVAQLNEALNVEPGGWHISTGSAHNEDKDKRREKEEIETELLRRYKDGDNEAHLAIFDR